MFNIKLPANIAYALIYVKISANNILKQILLISHRISLFNPVCHSLCYISIMPCMYFCHKNILLKFLTSEYISNWTMSSLEHLDISYLPVYSQCVVYYVESTVYTINFCWFIYQILTYQGRQIPFIR